MRGPGDLLAARPRHAAEDAEEDVESDPDSSHRQERPQAADIAHQHQHGAEHAADGTGRADHRVGRCGKQQDMDQARHHAGRQIEQDEAAHAQHPFDRRAECRQGDHVDAEMHPAAMQELIGDGGGHERQEIVAAAAVGGRHQAELLDEGLVGLLAQQHSQHLDGDVDADQPQQRGRQVDGPLARAASRPRARAVVERHPELRVKPALRCRLLSALDGASPAKERRRPGSASASRTRWRRRSFRRQGCRR